MSPTTEMVLIYLLRSGAAKTSSIGLHLWGQRERRPQDYCLPAGRVMCRLAVRRLVEYRKGVSHEWTLTTEGESLAEQLAEAGKLK